MQHRNESFEGLLRDHNHNNRVVLLGMSAAPSTASSMHAGIRSREGMASLAAIITLFSKVGKELLIEGQRDVVR
jgi:molybdopterin synthase catalytic subunit